MNRLKFLKLLVAMPFAAPAMVTACGKTQITCGKFSSTGNECVCNPAIVAWDFLKSNGATVDDDSFLYVADQCDGLIGNDSYRNWHNAEVEEILRMCKLGNFMVYVNADGVYKAAKFWSEEEWRINWEKMIKLKR